MYTDTGELAAAAATWGVAHPTGYPLLTLVGHVWSLLPWPSTIGGLNILAALFTAGGVAFLTVVVQHFTKHIQATQPWLPIAIGVAFGLCGLVWAQSTAYEVYSLNLLLVAATTYACVRSASDVSVRWTLVAGTMYGLALSNHLSSVFLAPGLFVLWWNRNRKQQHWLALILPILLGLSLYALLPLRSTSLPPINWGWVHRGLDAFMYHVKGTQFGVWMFSDSKALATNFRLFIEEASRMLLWVGWIPTLAGMVVLLRENKKVALGLIAILVGNLAISLGYAIPDISAYFLPSIIVLMAFCGIGLARFLTRVSRPFQFSVLLLPLCALALNLPTMNYRTHRAVEAYTQWAWANLEPNAIVMSRQWDYMLSAMWYQQTVEHVRPDVAIIDKELLRRTWYIPHLQHEYPEVMKGAMVAAQDFMPWLQTFESDASAFNAVPSNGAQIQRRFVTLLNALILNNPNRPFYVTPEILKEEQGFAEGYRAVPVGPFYRLTKDTALAPRTATDGLELLASSLQNRTERLDSGLRITAIGMLTTDAVYAYQFLGDTAKGRYLRNLVVGLDPKSRAARALIQRIP